MATEKKPKTYEGLLPGWIDDTSAASVWEDQYSIKYILLRYFRIFWGVAWGWGWVGGSERRRLPQVGRIAPRPGCAGHSSPAREVPDHSH